ncbi:MAG TPA: hypothetical protein VGN54_05630 [Mycobacteriales bacterium]|nr:hypothetical protein [Mycobacteriales bacterium]
MSTLIVLLAAVAVAVIAAYLAWLAGRHERLAARADAGWAALDAQLVRRAAPARLLAAQRANAQVAACAERALSAHADREEAENALGRALRQAGFDRLPPDQPASTGTLGAAVTDLHAAAARVRLSRQFFNDAVRDLRALRRRPAARLLRLGHGDDTGPTRTYFEIDDTVFLDQPAQPVQPEPPAQPEQPEQPEQPDVAGRPDAADRPDLARTPAGQLDPRAGLDPARLGGASRAGS